MTPQDEKVNGIYGLQRRKAAGKRFFGPWLWAQAGFIDIFSRRCYCVDREKGLCPGEVLMKEDETKMKKACKWLVLLLVLCLMCTAAAFAQEDETVKFESQTLEKLVREALDKGKKEPILQKDLEGVTRMAISGSEIRIDRRMNVWDHVDGKALSKVSLNDLKLFPNLTHLRVQLGECKPEALAGISGLPKLKELCIDAESIKSLEALKDLPMLSFLMVQADGLSSLESLEGVKHVKSLTFSGCNDLSDLSALENFDHVSHLSISHCPGVTSIAPMCGMEHLVQLNLSHVGITSFEPLRQATRKFSLYADNVFVKDWSVAYGFGKTSLISMKPEKITFASERFEKQIRKAIGREDDEPVYTTELASITELTISSGKIELGYDWYWEKKVRTKDKYGKAMELEDLRYFPQLTHLFLDVPYNTSESLAPLSELSNLNTLCIRGNKITSLEALSTLHYLETLELMGKGITDLTPVSQMSTLDHFSMYHTSVESLEPLKSLRYLGMGEVKIGDCKKIKDYSPIDHVGNKEID